MACAHSDNVTLSVQHCVIIYRTVCLLSIEQGRRVSQSQQSQALNILEEEIAVASFCPYCQHCIGAKGALTIATILSQVEGCPHLPVTWLCPYQTTFTHYFRTSFNLHTSTWVFLSPHRRQCMFKFVLEISIQKRQQINIEGNHTLKLVFVIFSKSGSQ